MQWKLPPKIKIYEALGAIGDDRIRVSDNEAHVISSSGGKIYEVQYDPGKNAIASNDNGSYWQGYLGYPAIAFLMKKGILPFDDFFATALSGILWKDINARYKNNFEKTAAAIHEILERNKIALPKFLKFIEKVLVQIEGLKLEKSDKMQLPPKGY